MSVAMFERNGPWTEEEYLALDDTSGRVELFDGSLHMTPAPTLRHQNIAAELLIALRPAARAVGLNAFETINVRLKDARLTIPDLAIIEDIDLDTSVVDASAVRMVCEITSRSNAATDRVLKMHYYAAAKIGWYLIAEQDTQHLHLHRLHGVSYVEEAVAKPGEVLRLTEPVVAEIHPEQLYA